MTKVRIPNSLVIFVVKRHTLLIYVVVRRPIRRTNPRTRVIVTNATSKDTRHKTTGLGLSKHQDLMVTATTTKSMDIELLSVDQSLCGHKISLQGGITMHTTTTGITIPGRAFITVRSMVMFLRTA